PSLYWGFGGSGGIGGGATGACSRIAAGNSPTGAGASEIGAATDGFTVAGVAAARGALVAVAERPGFSDEAGTAETEVDAVCVAADLGVVSAAGAGIANVEICGDPPVAGAGITGRRASACKANRSAADFVRTYPAAYTASTAAELSATRLF